MNRNLALEFIRVTEAAALGCARLMGRGDEKAADQAAVTSMRSALNSINFNGTVVIGEGERDDAPMLYIGEKVGAGGDINLDLALDPLEGTTICANGGPNALAVIAIAEEGQFLHAPDVYMDKIAVGPEAASAIDLNSTPTQNLREIAKAKKCEIGDLTVVILDRPRHQDLIAEVRAAGARIWMIGDGDVQAAVAAGSPNTGIDVLMGIGGAPEGVIGAAAMRCLGGNFQGKLIFTEDSQRDRARTMGVSDPDKVHSLTDLASGRVMFCATGVTEGSMLRGVQFHAGGAHTHSMVMRSETQTLRFIEAHHNFGSKPRHGY